MEDMKVISIKMYDKPIRAISSFSSNEVLIIGEQIVEYEGRTLEQYLYNMVGYVPNNGKPFVSLKDNLIRV